MTSLAGKDINIEEIRSIASFYTPYPPSIHALLFCSPKPLPNEKSIPHQGPYATNYGTYSNDFQRYGLMNVETLLCNYWMGVEIRELLIDHISHRCCWGSRLACT
ncbi:hypothetical protein Goari_011504 [Gossypium aridum]|uniref:Uncharacterized protein n=1 Tax=Gossypium aridum TaxID=34290 RepID=A0A7J8WXU0_GOSAI|nr:hypothetical protein [Gossypium aridum]